MRFRLILVTAISILLLIPAAASAGGRHDGHDGHHGQKAIKALVREHIKALSDCDADALVAGYTKNATLFFPDGVIVEGEAALQELYDGFVKAPTEGGLCGLQAEPVKYWIRGRTAFVKFEVTAPFLEQTYFSTDGYYFKGNRIAAEISTFDASKLVFKK
jgi:hypothetical protein